MNADEGRSRCVSLHFPAYFSNLASERTKNPPLRRWPILSSAPQFLTGWLADIITEHGGEAVAGGGVGGSGGIAGSGGTPATMNVFYGRRFDGSPWHSVIIRGGGMGASSSNDGYYDYIFPESITISENTPIRLLAVDDAGNTATASFYYPIGPVPELTRTDFREE